MRWTSASPTTASDRSTEHETSNDLRVVFRQGGRESDVSHRDPSTTTRMGAHRMTRMSGRSATKDVAAARERVVRMPPRWFVRLFWSVHRGVYRVTRGSIGLWPARVDRWGTLCLTTTGRRSGRERRVILGYLEDGPNLVTMAMNGWADGEPAWWLNLQEHPDTTVDCGSGPRPVRARAARGAERSRLWARWGELDRDLDAYAARRSTETAVVVLEPRLDSRPTEEREEAGRAGPRGPVRRLHQVKRWMYRGGRPQALARSANRLAAFLYAFGLASPGNSMTLEVAGRRTGRSISVPVVVADHDGERYLVSMLGEHANWVQNVRAAHGAAVLRRNGAVGVRLVEVEPADRAPILRRYLAAAPGARPHIPVDRDAPLADFVRIADRYPVFRIVPDAGCASAPVAAGSGLSRTERLALLVEHEGNKRLRRLGTALYRRTSGRIGPRGRDVLLLTTRGRRSGRDHTVLLQFFPDRDGMVVAAANAGRPALPDWYRNLMAGPPATAAVGGSVSRVRPVELVGDEAAAMWLRVLRRAPTYDRYRRAAGRAVPLVRLVPADT
jgi:F420H(2)-dependent quinone reductase